MPNTRDLRRRIKSIKNTSQITKAMQMVAASKMRRAQQSALAGRPYSTLINKVLKDVTARVIDLTHPLMEVRPVKTRAVIVISSDKGLAGALNSNLMREVTKFDKNTTTYIAAGRKASQFVARTQRKLAAEFTYRDAPLFSEARAISRFAQEMFLKGEVEQVDILYTKFISTLTQRPEVRTLLPVGDIKGLTEGTEQKDPVTDTTGATEYIFEPGPDAFFGALLPHYLNYQVFHILLEAKASEHSARMVAMKNATDNAKQLIKDLTLEYNKLRQGNITKELLEIASATMGMG